MIMRRTLIACLILAGVSLSGQDKGTTLWYRQPAKDWNEALPVGNGRIGAMVFGDPWNETIQLNEESLWAGCPQDGNAASADRIPEIRSLLLDGRVAEADSLANLCLEGDPIRIRSYQTFGELEIRFFEKEKDVVLEEINRIHMESSPGEVMSVYNEIINGKKKK